MITLTWQGIITLGSVIGVIAVILGYYNKILKFVNHQKEQDTAIKSIQAEQTLVLKGVLACLQGLAEQGCDGPVHDAENEINSYLVSNHGKTLEV